jgi:hypothetical protein
VPLAGGVPWLTAKSFPAGYQPSLRRQRGSGSGHWELFICLRGGRLLSDSVTLVNVIPKVLNYGFDAGIPTRSG